MSSPRCAHSSDRLSFVIFILAFFDGKVGWAVPVTLTLLFSLAAAAEFTFVFAAPAATTAVAALGKMAAVDSRGKNH